MLFLVLVLPSLLRPRVPELPDVHLVPLLAMPLVVFRAVRFALPVSFFRLEAVPVIVFLLLGFALLVFLTILDLVSFGENAFVPVAGLAGLSVV
jgi:hypothetical protein